MGIQHTRIFTSVFGFLTAQLNTGQNKKKTNNKNNNSMLQFHNFFYERRYVMITKLITKFWKFGSTNATPCL